MNHSLKTYTLVVTALCLLAAAGCSYPMDAPGRGETGLRITVQSNEQSEGAGERTLYPKADFIKYVLSFSGPSVQENITLEKGQPSVNIGGLAAGTWTITAVGWVVINGNEYPAAEGSVQASVVSGSFNPINITISAKLDGPPGFFSYTVNFPETEVSEASLYIYPFSLNESEARANGSLRERNLKDNNAGIISLPPGYYLIRALACL